jgi:hypothetical protein
MRHALAWLVMAKQEETHPVLQLCLAILNATEEKFEIVFAERKK